jgi:hypothetical protein
MVAYGWHIIACNGVFTPLNSRMFNFDSLKHGKLIILTRANYKLMCAEHIQLVGTGSPLLIYCTARRTWMHGQLSSAKMRKKTSIFH